MYQGGCWNRRDSGKLFQRYWDLRPTMPISLSAQLLLSSPQAPPPKLTDLAHMEPPNNAKMPKHGSRSRREPRPISSWWLPLSQTYPPHTSFSEKTRTQARRRWPISPFPSQAPSPGLTTSFSTSSAAYRPKF